MRWKQSTPHQHETSLSFSLGDQLLEQQLFSLCARTTLFCKLTETLKHKTHIYRTAGQRRSAADLRWAKSTKIRSWYSLDQRRSEAHLRLTWSTKMLIFVWLGQTKMWATSSLTKSNKDVHHIFVDQVNEDVSHIFVGPTKISSWSSLTWFNEDLLLIFVEQQSYIYVFCVLGFQEAS